MPAQSRAARNIANASKEHCTAFAVFGQGAGVRTQAESHLELCHLMVLNASPDVADVREQVLFSYGRRNERRHYFDIVVTKTCGRRIACTVKPVGRLRRRFIDEMETIAWWVHETRFADSVSLLTDRDLDPVGLHNAKLLTAVVRDADPDATAQARRAIAALHGAVSLNDLSEAISREGRGHREHGYRALLRLIASRELVPLKHGKISPQTHVIRTGARQ